MELKGTKKNKSLPALIKNLNGGTGQVVHASFLNARPGFAPLQDGPVKIFHTS